jgi:hypothetical protein
MPPTRPRACARPRSPADAVPGSTVLQDDVDAQILLQDGTWDWAEITGQRQNARGRWCIGLRCYASPSVGGREGWFVYGAERVRRLAPVPLENRIRLVTCRSSGAIRRACTR